MTAKLQKMIEHLAPPNIFHKIYQKVPTEKMLTIHNKNKNMFRHSSLANIWPNKNKKRQKI